MGDVRVTQEETFAVESATSSVRVTQSQVFAVDQSAALGTRVTQSQVFSVYTYPSEAVRVTETQVDVVDLHMANVRVTQAQTFVVGQGRIDNRRVRAWGFSLDGHDFYVLRLGQTSTLVCDLTTQQWQVWDNNEDNFWKVQQGRSWIGMDKISFDRDSYTSNIVAGDDSRGILWSLAPALGYDEDPNTEEATAFTRQLTGGVSMRLRETTSCPAVYITASIGEPLISGATISLRTSDDNGKTWTSHGSITATAGDYEQEFVWRSLGLIKAPGRIFEITDTGATIRIDGLDMKE